MAEQFLVQLLLQWGIEPKNIQIYVIIIMTISIIWILFWKGWAMWIACKNNHKIWFIFILVINTFGILDILYIFLLQKIKKTHLNKFCLLKKIKNKKTDKKNDEELTIEPISSENSNKQ